MNINLKSFLLGVAGTGLVIGAILAFIVLRTVDAVNNTEDTSAHSSVDKKPDDSDKCFKRFERPISYEGKKKVSVQVMQVFDVFALAIEGTRGYNGEIWYDGKVVMIIGSNYYTDEIVNIDNPQQIGLYTYFNRYSRQMTVPVIQAESDIINK